MEGEMPATGLNNNTYATDKYLYKLMINTVKDGIFWLLHII